MPKAANLVKLSGNFLITSVIEALGEAMALVRKLGIDSHQYVDILTSTLFGAPVYKTYDALGGEQACGAAGAAAGRAADQSLDPQAYSAHACCRREPTRAFADCESGARQVSDLARKRW